MTVQEESLKAFDRMNEKINDLVEGIEILIRVNDFSAKDALLVITTNNDIQIDENIKRLVLQKVKSRLLKDKINV